MSNRLPLSALIVILLGASYTSAQKGASVWDTRKSAWLLLTPDQHAQVFHFADDYKRYMSVARTAQLSTEEVTRQAKAAGFVEFTSPTQVKPGARLIVTNRDRAIILAIIGSTPLTEGSRLIGAHQDSPHIDLKARPIYPAGQTGFALFKTRYYGGI